MLPNFLVLGAQKAGTTSLARYFEGHPDIYIPRQRETRFFVHAHLYSKGIPLYETAFFAEWAGERAVGEKTPEYLVHPDAPGRIRETLGEGLRFIVCLRSPAARAHSGYRQNVALGREQLSFPQALQAEGPRIARGGAFLTTYGYCARGFYAAQIRRYLSVFEDFLAATLFLTMDEIASDQERTWRRICGHLGVEYWNPGASIEEGRLSVGPDLLPEFAGDRVVWRGKEVRSPSPALSAYLEAYRGNAARLEPLQRAEELRLNRELFAEDISDLEKLLGVSFRQWL